MTSFLIQVNGERTKHTETNAKFHWQESIEHNVYINYNWRERLNAWQKAKKLDNFLLYTTGTVDPYPMQIKFVGTIKKVEPKERTPVGNDNVRDYWIMGLEITENNRGIPLNLIKREIRTGSFSTKMNGCGNRGFNIGIIEDSDYERIIELARA